jgi:transposase
MTHSLQPLAVGIDIAKDKFDICVLSSETGEMWSKTWRNNWSGIQECISELQAHQVSAETPIVLESTGSLHWLVCLLLQGTGYTKIHCINPILTKKYQKSSIRDSKTDRIDAHRLAEMGLLEAHLPVWNESVASLWHKKHLSLLSKLESMKQQFKRVVKDAETSLKGIGYIVDLSPLKEVIMTLDRAIHHLHENIQKNTVPLAHKLAEKKGVSIRQTSIILLACEWREFHSRDALVAFLGLDVRQRQSGAYRGKQRLSKRGNPFVRKILFQLGWSLSKNDPEYRAYYEQLRDRKLHYFTVLNACARKYLRYLYSSMKQHPELLILPTHPSWIS